jgi:2-polyprenyl-3-methyl-5-hydroxy-6-metoxy-1,4-benzoquinol methylase
MLSTRSNRSELLDQLTDSVTREELAGNLRDMRRANRYFGGTRAVVKTLLPIIRTLSDRHDGPVTVLDLATGSGDIPVALLEAAHNAALSIRVIATDLQPEVLAAAGSDDVDGALTIEQADARALPYADNAFDIVTLALAFHHFDPADAVRVLNEMQRVGRHALLISDLARTLPGYGGAWLFGHLLTRNRLTRHDAPLSVKRAYTPAEALELTQLAGWRRARVRSVLPFRYVLTGQP